MRLKDVQKDEKDKMKLEQIVSARVPLEYKSYIVVNKVEPRKLIMKAIDEIRENEKQAKEQ
jgi:hypothetical protein